MTNLLIKKDIISIYFVAFIILINFIGLFPFGNILDNDNVVTASNWTESSTIDFNNGTLDNVVVTSNGKVRLAQQIKHIEDNYTDQSKISSKRNVIIDTANGEAKLIKIIRTYGPSLKYNYVGIGGFEIKQTPDGGYILVGNTNAQGAGEYDVWLIKTDHFGNMQWNRTLGGRDREYGFSFDQTSDGGYVIVGFTESYNPHTFQDNWLVKTDSYGYMQWNRTFNMPLIDEFRSVQQTSDSGYIIVGDSWQGIWVIKTNSTGEMEWNRSFGEHTGDIGYSVQQTLEGGYIITGTIMNQSQHDIYLIKIDKMGNLEWNKTFGGSSWDRGYSVQKTSDGGYIITGETNSYGIADIWLIKTDSFGNMQWNKTFGGNDGDSGSYTQQITDGGYIIVGNTESYGAGEFDIWLIKTDSSGNMKWNRTFGGGGQDISGSVQQTSDGGYIIGGSTQLDDHCYYAWLIKTNSYGNIQYDNGELISINLLSEQKAASINSFNYKAIIPPGTNIKVQFSQDNISWYNSSGSLNGFDLLQGGSNSINLLNLGWTGSNFYYKLKFISNNKNSPAIQNINISVSKYLYTGSLESQPFDSGGNLTWMNLNWDTSVPMETAIKFQLRSAKNQTDLISKEFVGPDGNKNTYYMTSGTILWSGYNNDRWMQYKMFLSTINTSKSPILNNVTISFNYFPKLISSCVRPFTGNITTEFNFTIIYIDKDNDQPKYIFLCINGINNTMNETDSTDKLFSDGKRYWYATRLRAGNYTYQFFTSDGNFNYSTNIEELKVNFGPLDRIIIEPLSVTITMNEYQIFIAKGFDADNNHLIISPIWEINGGGTIDQAGNFTPNRIGTWIIFANSSGISGNTSITVIQEKDDENTDTDNDTIPNYWEKEYELNITDPFDAQLDFDKDNLTNLEEFLNNTDPRNPDTDNDNLLDGDEIKIYHTNPVNPDTDGDGYNDGFEVDKNTDPLDNKDTPKIDKEDKLQNENYIIYTILGVIIIIILIIMVIYINKKV